MPDGGRDRDPLLGALVDEQAALRRVATLVARGIDPDELFSAVSDEVGRLFRADAVIARLEPDGSAQVIVGLTKGIPVVNIGTRWELEDFLASTAVYETGRPARNDHTGHRTASGTVADSLRRMDFVSTVATPIVVAGRVWGVMTVSDKHEPLPPDTEERVERFTELVATAIADAESRAELAASEARAGELAREQAALRRVATLVARGVPPEVVFSAVSEEVARLFDTDQAAVARFESEGPSMVVVGVTEDIRVVSIGTRWPLEDFLASTAVYRTGRPARSEKRDYENESGAVADSLREINRVSTVAAPIVVEGELWGVMTVTSTHGRLPPDAEQRLEKFTELVGTAIANADSRAELAASRARAIAAGDDARRRIERDLHDGAQQRLVTLAVALRRAQAKIPAGLDELRADLARVGDGLASAVEELRETSRGIHPAVLTEGGLMPALKALGRRSAVRVKLDTTFEQRLPHRVEIAAYYTVSEAVTNASKHAGAKQVWVSLRREHELLYLSIRDDGVGGADPRRGSGLVGLRDRIEALGGRLEVTSPPGQGTLIAAALPIRVGSAVEGAGSPEQAPHVRTPSSCPAAGAPTALEQPAVPALEQPAVPALEQPAVPADRPPG